MHTIETKNGKINLRLPNYPQAMRMVGDLGLSSGRDVDHFELLAIVAEKGEQFVDKISIKGVKNYSDLLEDPAYSEEITAIVNAITGRLEEFSTGKKKG